MKLNSVKALSYVHFKGHTTEGSMWTFKGHTIEGSVWIFKLNIPVMHSYYNTVAIYEHILKTINFNLNE